MVPGMYVAAMLAALMLLSASGVSAAGKVTPESFERKVTLTVSGSYLVYLPPDYDPKAEKRWPLMLFLHGAGERGDDVQRVKIHGPMKVAESRPEGLPFIIVAPQCPAEQWWDKKLEMLNALLDKIQEDYRIDPDRIYCTGLSMGGFGTWALVSEHPERFAAAVPICGGGNPWTVCRMKGVPVWAFHGAKDNVVPLSSTEEMIEALRKCGAEPLLTIYPEAQHDSWTQTYDDPKLYEWLLQHKRGKEVPKKP